MPIVLIPSRYNSSRFPGKSLAKINGLEMIVHVVKESIIAVGKENVYVVTDDDRIVDCVSGYGYQCIKNNLDAISGSDRIANAVVLFNSDLIVNVQGDEPLVKYTDILSVIEAKRDKIEYVINCFCYEKNDINNLNTPKVVTDGTSSDNLVYISRQPVPTGIIVYKRQIGIYAYWKEQLVAYYGAGSTKGVLESYENIEILRLLEYGVKIKMVQLTTHYQSVDVPEDIKKVEDIMNGVVK